MGSELGSWVASLSRLLESCPHYSLTVSYLPLKFDQLNARTSPSNTGDPFVGRKKGKTKYYKWVSLCQALVFKLPTILKEDGDQKETTENDAGNVATASLANIGSVGKCLGPG